MQPHLVEPQPTDEIAARLQRMGLRSDDLRGAAFDANDEALGCTENDVASRAGFVRWALPMRRLGDVYVPKGFSRERPGNFELLISPDRKFAITVAPGDYHTGTDEMPSTRIERGPLTRQAVSRNRHQAGFDEISPDFAAASAPAMIIWFLLVHYDEAADEIRLELSVPVEFTPTPKSERGYVTAFAPRLRLPAIPLSESIDDDDLVEDSRIEVPVARR